MAAVPYNPLDKLNLARSIETELRSRSVDPLSRAIGVVGAGVYAIYYRGDFAAYRALAVANAANWDIPIYVGKAIPRGGRKGGLSAATTATGNALDSRIRKHAKSIEAACNLSLDDFAVRHIVLDDIWIPLGENILIETFKPLWNVAVEGFGINDPGEGRSKQKRSPWDILHPGRSYAARLTGGGADIDAINGRIDDHFAGRPMRALPRALAEIAEDVTRSDRGEV